MICRHCFSMGRRESLTRAVWFGVRCKLTHVAWWVS